MACSGTDPLSPSSTGLSGRSSLPPLRTPTVNPGMRRVPGHSSLPRNNRGFSRKLQDMLKKQSTGVGETEEEGTRGSKVKYEPRNWKQLSERQLSKLSRIERSRYLAYEPIPKDIIDVRLETLKRIRGVKERERGHNQKPTLEDIIEFERNSELVGQLKAAEARHRIQLLRMGYQCSKEEELVHLIGSQPSSIEAVRLQSFIPPLLNKKAAPDILGKQERIRCEKILEDDKGLTLNRTL